KPASDSTRRATTSMARLRTWSTDELLPTAAAVVWWVMKKLLVVAVILAAAAACGGAQSEPATGRSQSAGGALSQPAAQPKTDIAGGSTNYNGPATPDQLAVQGPKVIRQGQLTVTAPAGTFDHRRADVRARVQPETAFTAGP